ncbi:MAG TPA: hypothetical protein VF809_00530, partial [Candidatus Saccharimonadales bacterium]
MRGLRVLPRRASVAWRALRRYVSVKFSQLVRLGKFLHHHTARRPHDHLSKRWSWYRNWHAWNYHKHVHALVVVGYFLIIGAYMLGVYQRGHAASDLANNWDFSNSSNYVADGGVETAGSSVRLKAQNYATDANTMGLYHFDESAGDIANDSSTSTNNGAALNSSFVPGQLNNALSLNGASSKVRVPDSSSSSLSQQSTIEAWTRFGTEFGAGTHDHEQAVVDKGAYKLYYDQETGKVSYELANSVANSWTQQAGNDIKDSWDLNGKSAVASQVAIGD